MEDALKTQKTVLQGVALIGRSAIDAQHRPFIRKTGFTVTLTVYSLSFITDLYRPVYQPEAYFQNPIEPMLRGTETIFSSIEWEKVDSIADRYQCPFQGF